MVEHVFNEAGWLADPSKTAQDFSDFLTKNVTHSLTQSSFAAGSGVITVGGAPAADGQAAWVDPAGANDTQRQLEIFDQPLGRTVGIPKKHMVRASLPATGEIAEMVYVTDLQITVEWRDAPADAVLSGTGMAGWHPISSGVGLFSNATGATIEANRVVALAAATGTRNIAKTTLIAQRDVLGVAMHDIANGTNGYVALPGFGHPIPVRVNPTIVIGVTTIEVAAGDFLCTSSATAGEARTRGPFPASGMPAAGSVTIGMPDGAFARSLEDRLSGAGVGNVMAMLLPGVGQGTRVKRGPATIFQDDTTATNQTGTVQACRGNSNLNGGQNANDDTFISAKHLPIRAVLLNVELHGTMAASGAPGSSIIIGLDPDTASASAAQVTLGAWGKDAADMIGFRASAEVQTCDSATPTIIGNSFKFAIVSVDMTSIETLIFEQTGYIY